MTTDTFAPGFAPAATPTPRVTVRGAYARRLRRLTHQADERAQRRFRAWLRCTGDREARLALSDRYQESERLYDALLAARFGHG